MFSGAGLYYDGVMFGLVVRGTIYLKADHTSIADFEREGSGPFTYTRGTAPSRRTEHALPYWRLPTGSTTIPTSLRSGPSARSSLRSGRSSRRGSKNKRHG